MVPSLDGGDEFVGVLGPGKGLWACIGVVEETVDGIFEFLEERNTPRLRYRNRPSAAVTCTKKPRPLGRG